MFCKFHKTPAGGSKSSSSGLLAYMDKEDKKREDNNPSKGFFSSDEQNLSREEAQAKVEHKYFSKSLGKEDDRFYQVSLSFSKEELRGKSDQELIDFAKSKFAENYAQSIKGKEQDPNTIAWVGKLEHERKYSRNDKEVIEGTRKSGQLKEGDNRHIHICVARKTLDNKKVSPHSNHFRGDVNTGNVKSGFDQDRFKILSQESFDKQFEHKRSVSDDIKTKLHPYRPDLIQNKLKSLKNDQNKQKNISSLTSQKLKQYKKAKKQKSIIEKFKNPQKEKAQLSSKEFLKAMNEMNPEQRRAFIEEQRQLREEQKEINKNQEQKGKDQDQEQNRNRNFKP